MRLPPMKYALYAYEPLKIKITKHAKTHLAQSSNEVQSAGGPREGNGGAVAAEI
jgi:hypothetical protein